MGSALGSFPDPSQAIMETWRALEVGVSPKELLVSLSGYQGNLEGPPGLLDGMRVVWEAHQG